MISLKWGSTIEEHDQRPRARCFVTRGRVYLKLSQEIFEVRKIEVNYVGQVFTQNGVKPDPEKVRAILDAET